MEVKRKKRKVDEREIIFRDNMQDLTDKLYPVYLHAKTVHADEFVQTVRDARIVLLQHRKAMELTGKPDCDQLFLSAVFTVVFNMLNEGGFRGHSHRGRR